MEVPTSTQLKPGAARKRRFLSPTTDQALSPASKMLLVGPDHQRISKKDTARLLWGNVQKKLNVEQDEVTQIEEKTEQQPTVAKLRTQVVIGKQSSEEQAFAAPRLQRSTSVPKQGLRSTSPFEINAPVAHEVCTDENAIARGKSVHRPMKKIVKTHSALNLTTTKAVKATKAIRGNKPKKPLGTRSVNLV